jgi:hypothetical protein
MSQSIYIARRATSDWSSRRRQSMQARGQLPRHLAVRLERIGEPLAAEG